MTLLIFIIGLSIGSFLNVCIYRIPRQQSVVSPPSACPACRQRLAWPEMIPLVGWLMLRARCRYCREPISWRYPMVEALNGLLYVLGFTWYGPGLEFWAFAFLASLMVIVTFIDIEFKIIPNSLVVIGLAAGLGLGFLRPAAGVKFMVLGFAVGVGLLMAVAFISGGQMGMGDVKLAAVMGVFLGWQGVLTALFLAFLGGALYGIGLMVFLGRSRKTAIPFGPFMAGAAVISFIWTDQLIDWYWRLIW